ncbi:MAG TPA: PilN domain-containing protein [Fimbriimonas sp.]|nr:PilN domain-containing protein [Fimbriimonas sp.]
MSKGSHNAGLVIEWSPKRIVAYDVQARSMKSYDDPKLLPYAGRTALLAISRRSVFVRAARVPNAAPEDIRTVVQVKLAELFPVPPTDLAYDFLLLPDINAEGRLAMIVAMPVSELRKAKEQMASAGIKVLRTLPVALGSAMLAESLGLKDAAVVEKMDEVASVDIVTGGVLRYSRVVAPTAPIEVEISRTFNAAGLTCTSVIAAGGVQVGEADVSSLSTALEALALSNPDRLKIDLQLPETVAARELAARKRRQMVAGLFLAVSLGISYNAWSSYLDEKARIDQEKANYVKNLVPITKEQKDEEAFAAKQRSIEATLAHAFAPAQKMGDIVLEAANLAPSDVWLTGFNLERGKELTLRGTSKTEEGIPAYVAALNNDRRFRNVKLVNSNHGEIEKIPVVEFNISAFPIGNLPITLQQKAGVATVVH